MDLNQILKLIERIPSIEAKLDQLVSAKEGNQEEVGGVAFAAKTLGKSTSAIYQLMHRRKIKFHRPFGGRPMFKKSELLDWKEAEKK